MAIRDMFKISRKTFFNPSAWIDYEGIKNQNRAIWAITARLFRPEAPTRQETFEEALIRLNLTEADIQKSFYDYRLYSIVFVVMGVILIGFGFFLLFQHGSFHGLILSICASALSLATAFRYDFWAFQIKQRRLGCTFEEWKKSKI